MTKYWINWLRSAWDFQRIGLRVASRAREWVGGYNEYRAGTREDPPFPPVVQLIPTERCNLRCKMCNQWGDEGYFIKDLRPVSSMPIADLIRFLDEYREIRPDFLLSLHGGEPFMYREMGKLLDYIAERRIDVTFSTNGTLLAHHAEKLARINRHAFYLLSIDGGKDTNDQIRGAGVTDKILKSIEALRAKCLEQGTGLPKLIVNYCVNEHNPEDIDLIESVARKVGAAFVNYNLRWFMPESAGKAYNEVLEKEFQVKPSNAWVGWVTNDSFEEIDQAIDRIYEKKWKQILLAPFRPLGPFFTLLPKGLTREQAKRFYHDYKETFGIKSCIMPSFWLRVHSSGELIYCPGHPDIIPGNVFKQPVKELFLNEISKKLRRKVEKELLPICNRCCGLYMTYNATKHLGDGFYPNP